MTSSSSSSSSLSSMSSLGIPSEMSCSSAAFDERGRHGINVQQEQQGTNYPLVQPSEDIRYLLADMYLAYEDPADYNSELAAYEPPFRIAYLYGLGCAPSSFPAAAPTPTHAADVWIVDNNDETVFDSTQAGFFEEKYWGSRHKIFEWRDDDNVCRIVQHTKWSEDDEPEPRDYDLHLEPANGVLDERVSIRLPKRVKSLKVLTSTFEAANVEFKEGHNVGITLGDTRVDPDRRRVTEVNLAAAPGGGTGLFPGCDEPSPVITKINGVSPTDAGDFLLTTDKDEGLCYWIRQPTTISGLNPNQVTPTQATLQFGNSCVPCCDCDDFVATAERLNDTACDYHDIGNQAEGTRNLMRTVVDRWNQDRRCRHGKPLQLAVVPTSCPYIEVAGSYCNHTKFCQGPVFLNFHVDLTDPDDPDRSFSSATSDTPEVACRGAMVMNSIPERFDSEGNFIENPTRQEAVEPIGSFPDFGFYWWGVDPQDMVVARFRLVVADPCKPWVLRVRMTGCIGYAAYSEDGLGVEFEDGTPGCAGPYGNIMARDPVLNEVVPAELESTVTAPCPDPCNPDPDCS